MACRQGTTGDTIRRAVHAERLTQLPARTQNSGHSRQLATLRGLSEKCSYIRGRAGETFPFEDHSFDFIFDIMAASTFMVGNGLRERYSREIKRLLKPGGVLFIFTGRSDGEYQKKLDISRRGVEDGTFYRSMDGTLEKGYTRSEIINLCSPLKPAVLESQSRYFRAFGHQELVRPEGFWFAVFMNEE
ncbi:MAG: methyltransferase domain-containing protein [Gammaproteobacteria bacterium]